MKISSQIAKRTLLVSFLAVVVVALFAGCSFNDSANESDSFAVRDYSDQEQADIVPEGAFSLDEMLLMEGLFWQENGADFVWQIPSSTNVYTLVEGIRDYSKSAGQIYSGVNAPFEIDAASGGRLLYVSSQSSSISLLGFVAVSEQGFLCSKPLEDFSRITNIDEVNGELVDGEDDVEFALNNAGASLVVSNDGGGEYNTYLLAGDPLRLLFGKYTGTSYDEGYFDLEIPYYRVPKSSESNSYDCTVEKTKDGYFVVGFSDVPPGVYLLKGCPIAIV